MRQLKTMIFPGDPAFDFLSIKNEDALDIDSGVFTKELVRNLELIAEAKISSLNFCGPNVANSLEGFISFKVMSDRSNARNAMDYIINDIVEYALSVPNPVVFFRTKGEVTVSHESVYFFVRLLIVDGDTTVKVKDLA